MHRVLYNKMNSVKTINHLFSNNVYFSSTLHKSIINCSIKNINNVFSENIYKIKHTYKIKQNFANVKQIGIIGWGSQASAQAQNLRDSLFNSNINITIGLRTNSDSIKKVEDLNFKTDTVANVLQTSDLNLLLISDDAQVKHYKQIFKCLKPGSTLGFSHGFLLKHLEDNKIPIRDDINIVGICPKGMGNTMRNGYLNNQGINASYAIHQDCNDLAEKHAIGWGCGIGSPYLFETDLINECKSDLVGERSVLLAAVQGFSESLYNHYFNLYKCKYSTYNIVVFNIIKNISDEIKNNDLPYVYNNLTNEIDKHQFRIGYDLSYKGSYKIISELYNDVENGSEIKSVLFNNKLPNDSNIYKISHSHIWKQNKNTEYLKHIEIKGLVAGIYIGCMIALCDVLEKNKHNYSEIVNESIIEATDSLNPYMFEYGIDEMIDNCSVTARIGCRKWAPRFDYMVKYEVLPYINEDPYNYPHFDNFLDHRIHLYYNEMRSIK